ncbi:MAG: class I SAM-dependent methyltransferase [Actinomycetota bacterium]|nr:class I SAM-dependent methyltransferase [Actinomycetota bacterium]
MGPVARGDQAAAQRAVPKESPPIAWLRAPGREPGREPAPSTSQWRPASVVSTSRTARARPVGWGAPIEVAVHGRTELTILAEVDAQTAEIYDAIAPDWAATRGEAPDGLGRHFRQLAGSGLVADLGCGPGRYLAQISAPVVGVDVSLEMLFQARRRPGGYPLVRGDLESLPFSDGSLASAFARHSYLHVPKERVGYALAELSRTLRRGGLLMLSLIEGTHDGRDLPGDDFPSRYFGFWTAGELGPALAGSGFTDINIEQAPRQHGEGDLLVTARR